MKIVEAVYQAGLLRLRPILLTTFTTTFGLAPIILEGSRQAQFLIPMAISVAYGLLFGTFILLMVLPAGFLAVNKIRFWILSLFSKDLTYESIEPAIRELDLRTEKV